MSNSTRKTFERLVTACKLRGIICEKSRGKIELTTPNGGTTAECETVREAWETYEGDSTFSSLPYLPIKIPQPAYLNNKPFEIACDCGSASCNGKASLNGLRFCCDGQHSTEGHISHFKQAQAAINCHDELLKALETLWAAVEDLSSSNRGFLAKLVLQDYARYNKALTLAPAAIRKAKEVSA